MERKSNKQQKLNVRKGDTVKVMAPGGDYWPLPWQLRRFHHVGWYDRVPPDPYAPLILCAAKLGARLDDPRYVHERMRGATPPNIYQLTEREKPFHGVRALRLSPIEPGKVFGRAGLLAHTYMLGPRGDSNGCVVFKNYAAFLQAFDGGDVKRLAVVAHLDANDMKFGPLQLSAR